MLVPPCDEPVICSGHIVRWNRRHLIDHPVKLDLSDHPHPEVGQLIAICGTDQMLDLFLAESSRPPCSHAVTGYESANIHGGNIECLLQMCEAQMNP